MKPLPEGLETFIEVIKTNLSGAPFLAAQTADVLGLSLFDAWKVMLEGRASVVCPQPTDDSGLAAFAAGCAVFAAATQIRNPELRAQALNLCDALVGHACLSGVEC